MINNIPEYELFGGEFTAQVDYENQQVVVYERGGWSRRYAMSFDDLFKCAKRWDMVFDKDAPEAELAELGTRLIIGEDIVSHGGNPSEYLPVPDSLTKDDKQVLQDFSKLVLKYHATVVARQMSESVRNKLLAALKLYE